MPHRLLWLAFALLLAWTTSQCQPIPAQETNQETTTEITQDAQTNEPRQESPPTETPAEQLPTEITETTVESAIETVAEAPPAETQPDIPPHPVWRLNLLPAQKVGTASASLLGHYDLSGEMFQMDKQAGLIDKMKQAGFSDWRFSAGRWEISTWLLPSLTDGTSCTGLLAAFPSEALAPMGASDLDLIKQRDWFVYTNGQPVTLADTQDNKRYDLAYLRKQLAIASAFGAAPFVSLDHTPRALAANPTPARVASNLYTDPCLKTFTNAVSNSPPADPSVYAAALVGLVKRTIEGSDGQAAQRVTHWEIGNEPEFPEFWDRTQFAAQGLSGTELGKKAMDAFFAMSLNALIQLDAYRSQSAHPNAKDLRFGLASFADHAIAIAALGAFDSTKLPTGRYTPLDFLSFHAYDNDPLVIVEQIKKVAAARATSSQYKDIELVLAEWGPKLDGQGWDANRMDLPLLMATVLTLGAHLGLDRAHHSIFWDFYSQGRIQFGLLAHDGKPKPLYHAYTLLAEAIGEGRALIAVDGAVDGKLDAGLGVAFATKDAQGRLRLLLINRDTKARQIEISIDGKPTPPTEHKSFDTPSTAPQIVSPSSTFTLLPQSIVLLRFP